MTRRKGQTVYIGDDITVSIAGINGGQVKLAFQAPDDVSILREELWRRDRGQ